MQPYFFPYVGYFQLINSVDVFVFYDDVNFIKRGWINRNNILVNSEASMFSIPLIKASQNKLINEIELGYDEKWVQKFFITLEHSYKKAPYFNPVFNLVQEVFNQSHKTIADLTMSSVVRTADYLGLTTRFEVSSKQFSETKGMDRADRLIEICRLLNAETYINPTGGRELYNKPYFKERQIELMFIENKFFPYKQFEGNFIPGLSIIDLLMFNSPEQVKELLNHYTLN
ncbi:MAG: WbqC family protein [Flavobacteriales bacterium]|nr:WbqC family protein [Flavobacteriales bacterium]